MPAALCGFLFHANRTAQPVCVDVMSQSDVTCQLQQTRSYLLNYLLFNCPLIYLSFYLIYLFPSVPVCQPVYRHLSVCPSVHPSTHLPTNTHTH